MVNEKLEGKLYTSVQMICEIPGWSPRKFFQVHAKYPFIHAIGVTGKINGSFCVTEEQVRIWLAYVQRQESRHPDMRRMRPEEPPEIKDIKGR